MADQGMAESNATATTTAHLPSLEQLSNDVLLLIVALVSPISKPACPNTKKLEKPLYELSLTSKRIRDLCTPTLFKKIRCNWDEGTLRERSMQMETSPLITHSVLAWDLRSYVGQNTVEPKDLAFAIATIFPLMPRLKELHLHFRDGHKLVTKLRAAFKKAKPSMAGIKTLGVRCSFDLEFIIDACTNLENLIIGMDSKWKKNLKAASNAPKLKYLELEKLDASWKLSHVEDIRGLLTNIPSLCLKGDLYKTKVSAFAEIFTHFPNLEHLAISDSQWVNEAALSRRYCDDRLFDAIFDLREDHPLNENRRTVARAYFSICLKLKGMRFLRSYESQRFRVERDGTGNVRNVQGFKENDWYGMPTAFPRF